MQDGEPQIHLAGKLPGAGTWVVKSIRPAAGYSGIADSATASGVMMAFAVGSTTETMGSAIKVLRFMLFNEFVLNKKIF
jgi:hypothetical protein